MKFLMAFIMVASSSLTLAKENGIGVILGSPTGLSYEHFFEKDKSIDAALGWSTSEGKVNLHSTYLFHENQSFYMNETPFNHFYGVGLKIRAFEKDDKQKWKMGPRAVFGISHDFEGIPLKAFAEIAGVLNLIEETNLDMDLNLGIRYMF